MSEQVVSTPESPEKPSERNVCGEGSVMEESSADATSKIEATSAAENDQCQSSDQDGLVAEDDQGATSKELPSCNKEAQPPIQVRFEDPEVSGQSHKELKKALFGATKDSNYTDYEETDDDPYASNSAYKRDDNQVERRPDLHEFLHYKCAPARSLVKQQEELLSKLRRLRTDLEKSEGQTDGAREESSTMAARLNWRQGLVNEVADAKWEHESLSSKDSGYENRYGYQRGTTTLSRPSENYSAGGSHYYLANEEENDYLSQPARLHTNTYNSRPIHSIRYRSSPLRTSAGYSSTLRTTPVSAVNFSSCNTYDDYIPGAYRERYERILQEAEAPKIVRVDPPLQGGAYERYWQRYGADDVYNTHSDYKGIDVDLPSQDSIQLLSSQEYHNRSVSPLHYNFDDLAQSEISAF